MTPLTPLASSIDGVCVPQPAALVRKPGLHVDLDSVAISNWITERVEASGQHAPPTPPPPLKLCKTSSGYVPNRSAAVFAEVFIWLVQLCFGALGCVQQASVCGVLMNVKPHCT